MLVLSRKEQEKIVLPGVGITITVTDIRPGKVRLGFSAPGHVEIYRAEVWDRIQNSSSPDKEFSQTEMANR